MNRHVLQSMRWMLLLSLTLFVFNNELSTQEQLPEGHPTGDLKKRAAPLKKIRIHGTTFNGTTGHLQSADRVTLLLMQEELKELAVLDKPLPNFTFAEIDPVASPMLIKVEYSGESWNLLIPPELKAWSKNHTIKVYDVGAKSLDVDLTSMLQIIRKKDMLFISSVLALQNKSSPPRSLDPSSLPIPLPDGAVSIRASLQHDESRMPIPVELTKRDGFYYMNRVVRPGDSGLTIEYEVKGDTLIDRLPQQSYDKHLPLRIILWQPLESKPKVSGGKAETIMIPDFGEGMKVTYDGSPVTYKFEGTVFYYDDPLNSDENPLFTGIAETALLIVAIFILLIAFIFVSAKFLNQDTKS